MKRMPLWPIAFGLTVWGAAIYIAVVGPWWPLAIVAVVSLLPGLVIGFVTLLGRGAKKNAQAVLDGAAAENARPGSAPPVAEPPVARESRARTNARNAGRRKGGKAGAVLVLLASAELHGCDKIERARAERRARESAEDGGAAADPDATAGSATAPGTAGDATTGARTPSTTTDVALDAALARAITPPDGLEATWRVDPFVAALLAEQIRRGTGPVFSKLDAPIPEGPRVGFRVGDVPDGSILHRLGLRTGDVIETLGGVELSDASRLGFALDGAENKVDVMVFRDGISTVHSYRLTEGLAWRGLLADFPPGTAAVGGAPQVAANDVPTPTGGDVVPSAGGATPSTGGGASGGGKAPSGGGSTGGGKTPSGGGSSGGGSGGGSSGGGGSTPGASDPVRCESSAKCTVTRAYFDKMVASPSAVQSQANIVPAIANDVHSGYKLKSVKSGSAIAKLGFRAGDKITHVNGVDLTDELAALGLLGDLSSKSLFRIRYERNGSAATKTVVVE